MSGSSTFFGIFIFIVFSITCLHASITIPPKACYEGGPLCPQDEAECNGTKCVCKSGIGNGYFVCYGEFHEYCHIMNDPVALTFGHESFDLPLPCRYFVTHVSAIKDYNGWFISQCQTQVYAVNARSRGKFFVSGFDVIVEYMSLALGGLKQLHFRANGRVTNNGYEFDLGLKQGVADFLPFESSFQTSDYPYLGDVIFEVDHSAKKVHLYLEECGIHVVFRPANGSLGMNQTLMPGLSISYDKSLFPNNLRWLSDKDTVCLEPDLGKCSTGQVANTAHLNPSEAFVWRALYAGTPQTVHYPGETAVCSRVSQTIQTCTNVKLHQEAMEMCTFMIAFPLFANCMSEYNKEYESSVKIMELLEDCIVAFCSKDEEKCNMVKNKLNIAGCRKFAYNSFDSHSCEFSYQRN